MIPNCCFNVAKRAARAFALAIILSLLFLAMPAEPVLAQSVTLSPTSGEVDSIVSVSGTGFTPSAAFRTHFAYGTPYELVRSGTVAVDGTISDSFNVPNMPAGLYTVLVETSTTNSTSGTFSVVPAIVLSKKYANVGEQVTVDGTGFTATIPVTISFDNVTVVSAVTDANGSFTEVAFSVPEKPRGTHRVTVADIINIHSLSIKLIVRQSITITPTSGNVGTTVKVSGTGFRAYWSITLVHEGVVINTSPASVVTNAAGSFNATFNVPAIFGRTSEIKASDGLYTATATFTYSASISLTPTKGNVGEEITVSGTTFTPVSSVSINFDNTQVATIDTDGSGNFITTFHVPDSFNGIHTVVASDGTHTVNASFATSASIRLTPTEGLSGTEVTVSSTGFDADKSITITFADVKVGTTTTNANGSFSDKFTVPQYGSGNYDVIVSDGVNTASVVFTITISVSISQTTGNVGTPLTLSGSKFFGVVTIKYDDVVMAKTFTDAKGVFSVTFNVPASIHGEHIITVSDTISKIQTTFTMESVPPPVPAPLLPKTGAKAKSKASFDWEDVTDPSGVTYTLQIAPDADFTVRILHKQGLVTSAHTLTETEKLPATSEETPYYWRVRAIDGASNKSEWSASSSFYVSFFPDWAKYALIGIGALVVTLLILSVLGRRQKKA